MVVVIESATLELLRLKPPLSSRTKVCQLDDVDTFVFLLCQLK